MNKVKVMLKTLSVMTDVLKKYVLGCKKAVMGR